MASRHLGWKHVNRRRWRKFRREVLHRDGYRCRLCGGLATEVDHIVRIANGGAVWDLENCQAIDKKCHARKSAAESRARNRREGYERWLDACEGRRDWQREMAQYR